jgi:uncharacterized protein
VNDLSASLRSALAPVAGVRVAWLFGSRAGGRPRADSDLDLAVVYARHLDAAAREHARRQIAAAVTDALGALGERADVVDLDDADSAVAFHAVTEGVLLVARSEAERVRAVAFIYRRFDDEAPRRELYRRAAIASAERGHGRR